MKNILFVCVENSCRSQMAEAFCNMLGQEQVKAYSSGSRPSGRINPGAIAAMRDAGYDLSVHSSKGIGALPDVEYDFLVSMGCGDACPTVHALRQLEWDIPDPAGMDAAGFAKVRDQIRDKVMELISQV